MRLRGKLAAAAFVSVAMAVSTPASAGPIDVTYVGIPYGDYGDVSLTGGLPAADMTDLYFTGQIVLTTNDGTLDVWCIDLFHDIYVGAGSYTYSAGPLSTNNAIPPTALTPEQIALIEALSAYGDATLPGHSDPNDWSAAIQAEIWDIEYGTTAWGTTGFRRRFNLPGMASCVLGNPRNTRNRQRTTLRKWPGFC